MFYTTWADHRKLLCSQTMVVKSLPWKIRVNVGLGTASQNPFEVRKTLLNVATGQGTPSLHWFKEIFQKRIRKCTFSVQLGWSSKSCISWLCLNWYYSYRCLSQDHEDQGVMFQLGETIRLSFQHCMSTRVLLEPLLTHTAINLKLNPNHMSDWQILEVKLVTAVSVSLEANSLTKHFWNVIYSDISDAKMWLDKDRLETVIKRASASPWQQVPHLFLLLSSGTREFLKASPTNMAIINLMRDLKYKNYTIIFFI